MKDFIQRSPLYTDMVLYSIIIRHMRLTDSAIVTNLFSKKYKCMHLQLNSTVCNLIIFDLKVLLLWELYIPKTDLC